MLSFEEFVLALEEYTDPNEADLSKRKKVEDMDYHELISAHNHHLDRQKKDGGVHYDEARHKEILSELDKRDREMENNPELQEHISKLTDYANSPEFHQIVKGMVQSGEDTPTEYNHSSSTSTPEETHGGSPPHETHTTTEHPEEKFFQRIGKYAKEHPYKTGGGALGATAAVGGLGYAGYKLLHRKDHSNEGMLSFEHFLYEIERN